MQSAESHLDALTIYLDFEYFRFPPSVCWYVDLARIISGISDFQIRNGEHWRFEVRPSRETGIVHPERCNITSIVSCRDHHVKILHELTDGHWSTGCSKGS